MRRAISIMAFPGSGDAYTNCFYPPLKAQGMVIREGVFAGRWLWENLREVDYVHLHWPSFFYSRPTVRETLRGFAIFMYLVALTYWRGARLLWTVHNLNPHDRCVVPSLDRFTRRILCRLSSGFLIHGPSARAAVLSETPEIAQRVILIDHGHWVGYYPNTISRAAARAQLGLQDDDWVFLFIGLCKPYKNLETLIHTFAGLPGKPVLVIAGKFQDPNYRAKISAAIEHSKARIVLKPGFVPDDQIQLYMQACDVVTLPYAEILTSGAALLALSFGRPVVAPARGHLKDVIVEGCGVLYEPSQPDGLARAMRAVMGVKFNASRIVAQALQHDWSESAKTVAACLAAQCEQAPQI